MVAQGDFKNQDVLAAGESIPKYDFSEGEDADKEALGSEFKSEATKIIELAITVTRDGAVVAEGSAHVRVLQ